MVAPLLKKKNLDLSIALRACSNNILGNIIKHHRSVRKLAVPQLVSDPSDMVRLFLNQINIHKFVLKYAYRCVL